LRNTLICFALLAAIPAAAPAAKPISIEQFRQILDAAHATHLADDAVARQLGETRLDARLTGAALAELTALSPGPKTTQVLHVIADTSAFLDPPRAQLPQTPAPDLATQRAIVGRMIDYGAHVLPTLPNFLATRVSEHYVDTLKGTSEPGPAQPRANLFLLDVYRAPIGFRDGRETDDPVLMASLAAPGKKRPVKGAAGRAPQEAVPGLSSWGEFGPILGVVLLDAAKGSMSWARWELEDGKPVAVFQFSVKRSASSYTLSYCCRKYWSEGYPEVLTDGAKITIKPAYHGLFEVDPETGTILRITVEADLGTDETMRRASVMVEYGPVKIGETVRVCPTRSVAISVSPSDFAGAYGAIGTINRLSLNDVQFTDYRRFGSEATLVAELPPASEPPSSGEPVIEPAPVEVAIAPPAAPAQPAPPTPGEMEAEKEIQINPLEGLPGFTATDTGAGRNLAGSADAANFTLQVTTRSVEVGMIAEDKHGKPIGGLTPEQIEIYDNGHRQQIRSFHHATAGAVAAAAPAESTQRAAAPGTFSNAAITAAQEDAPGLLILLLDDSHLGNLDLNRARSAVQHFLAATRPTSRIALYSLNEHGFRVIQDVTGDHVLIAKVLADWIPDADSVAQGKDQDRKNAREEGKQTGGPPDPASVEVKEMGAYHRSPPDIIQTSDAELRQMGTNPLRYALEVMTALARHFASVPGHKSLVWISGDKVLTGWRDGTPATKPLQKETDAAFEHAKEALNEAQITLYAVDASIPSLGIGGFDSTVANPNGAQAAIQNGPLAPRASSPEQASIGPALQLIQGPVRQLAEATGGRAVNKGNDLKATLDGIDRDSNSLYEIGFDPDSTADGKFHTLEVKLPGRKDVVLRYRTGYLYSEETASTQQRFQQAVWSPQDATAVGLTAEVTRGPVGPDGSPSRSAVKLRINFPGLALEQKGGRWTDEFYIFVAERDDATQQAAVSGDTLRLSLRQATYDTGMPAGIPYQRAVEVKSKLGSVRVIVVDGNSGRMGSVTLPASALLP